MRRKEILEIIESEKIVAIVRLNNQEKIQTVLEGLVLGGVKVLEITSNTPGFLTEISHARKTYNNVLVGAGTVTNPNIASQAIQAGAQFLVTPNVNIEVIKLAHKNDIPVLMGALTPTEVCMAIEHGADIVKLFPAGNLGMDYFKAIKGPLNNVKLFVVGGINLENMKDWFLSGADGVGLGSVLVISENEGLSVESVKTISKKFVEIKQALEL